MWEFTARKEATGEQDDFGVILQIQEHFESQSVEDDSALLGRFDLWVVISKLKC